MLVDKYPEAAVPWIPRTEGSCQQTRGSGYIQCQPAHWPPVVPQGFTLQVWLQIKPGKKPIAGYGNSKLRFRFPDASPRSGCCCEPQTQAVRSELAAWLQECPTQAASCTQAAVLSCVGSKQHPGAERTLSQASGVALASTLCKQGCNKTPCVVIPENQEEMLTWDPEIEPEKPPSCFRADKLCTAISVNYLCQ